MEDSGVLLVLDNLETLLTPDGAWRDPRWALLMTALTSHDGESRVILTSRTVPAGLALERTPPSRPPADGPNANVAGARAVTAGIDRAGPRLPDLRKLLHADTGVARDPASREHAD